MIRLIILLTILATICISVTKPQMHKPVLVYDSDYKIVQEEPEALKNEPIQEAPIIKEERVIEVPKIEKTEQKSAVAYKPPVVKVEKQITKQVATPKTEKFVQKSKPTVTTEKTQEVVKAQSKPVVKEIQQTVKHEEPKVVKQQTVTQPVKTVEQKPVQKPQQQTQTVHLPAVQPTKTAAQIAREEEIAWNKWRSRLQNQIMADVRMPNIPYGTIFKFSFTVDKYGKITNVQTWSTTPNYTPHAIQYIAPVIRSYQGRSILNFPAGSNRVTTEVVGAWKISNSSKYSTPQDYNDTERVIR